MFPHVELTEKFDALPEELRRISKLHVVLQMKTERQEKVSQLESSIKEKREEIQLEGTHDWRSLRPLERALKVARTQLLTSHFYCRTMNEDFLRRTAASLVQRADVIILSRVDVQAWASAPFGGPAYRQLVNASAFGYFRRAVKDAALRFGKRVLERDNEASCSSSTCLRCKIATHQGRNRVFTCGNPACTAPSDIRRDDLGACLNAADLFNPHLPAVLEAEQHPTPPSQPLPPPPPPAQQLLPAASLGALLHPMENPPVSKTQKRRLEQEKQEKKRRREQEQLQQSVREGKRRMTRWVTACTRPT
mmetsp:Transcript_25404/g.83536  ORF Transcript_25404/g.83536 Transcript_25404/m.83536 type:complete len:306 (-) Transcript_25404:1447-2364(-)